ncbi:hypothetical protein J7T55_004157 [Diaporthe amygdali]|uniref:uncharacterized protein n=1 Tax=Phomopsis amygdali TaxID=1214568 RepID=UPI0022FE8EE6|nr:uncharacterized protein J7T55_004157 [Diaporthe amygdali]KAJ0115987.1 hypothetical protein J7T55_004157 [Diaporthe amygdali]
MPSPTNQDHSTSIPQLGPTQFAPGPSNIHQPQPSSPGSGTHRSLRKLASAHNLTTHPAPYSGPTNLRASTVVSNPPSLIAQQRLAVQQQQHQQHYHHRGLAPARRHASTTFNASPSRARANSDAPVALQLNAAAAAMSSQALRNSGALAGRTLAHDALSLERLIRDGPPDGDFESALESARIKVLKQEIKSDSDGMVSRSESPQLCFAPPTDTCRRPCMQSKLRIYVWLIMLDAPVLSTDDYLGFVHRGASPAYSKIRNDTFRTLTTDPLFRRRVSEASLIRLLNAIAWKLHDSRPQNPVPSSRQSLPAHQETPTHGSHGGHTSHGSSPAAKNRARALTLTTEGSESSMAPEAGTYVQGMNVLAAPFLYAARSEAEAFVAFHQLLTRECPGYIRGAMDGVHRGLKLVDKVLGIVDAKLSMFLTSKGMQAELYAFPSVMTLCACTPPLPEVLRLWDFLFAYGPHLNIVCIAAQLVIHRDELMASPNPSHFLRTFPALNAEKVQAMTLALLAKLPDDVYAEIVSHAM